VNSAWAIASHYGWFAAGRSATDWFDSTIRALLLPSLSETFGLILLEAWAAGTTVNLQPDIRRVGADSRRRKRLAV